MTTRNVNFKIGAPSQTGVDANAVVEKEFVASDFPLDVKVTNNAMFAVLIPRKFHLKPFHDTEKNSMTVKIMSLDSMHRMVSDLESIAENHKHSGIVTIDAVVVDNSLSIDDVPPAGDVPLVDDVPPVEPVAPPSKKTKGG